MMEEERLKNFINWNKTKYKQNNMDINRVNQLENLDKWKWDVYEAEWDKNYNELKKWMDTHNGKYPIGCSKNKKEYKLAVWIASQKRRNKKNYRGKKLNKYQMRKIKLLKNWNNNGKLNMWNINYNCLKRWLSNHNNKYPHHSSNKKEQKIAMWVSRQKRIKAGDKKGYKLTAYKIIKLEELPKWTWDYKLYIAIKNKEWINKYNKLKIWLEKYKKYPRYFADDIKEKKLGIWVEKQKYIEKHEKILIERKIMLEKLFKWKWII